MVEVGKKGKSEGGRKTAWVLTAEAQSAQRKNSVGGKKTAGKV